MITTTTKTAEKISRHEPALTSQAGLNRFSPSIHPNYIRLLCAHVASKGVSVEALCADAALDWASLIQRQHFMSLEQFQRLVFSAQRALDCPWLALDMTGVAQVSAHGPLGYGAMAAKDLEQALKLVEMMMPTRLSLYRFELGDAATAVNLNITPRIDLAELESFIEVMLVSALLDLLTKMTGHKLEGLTVNFSFEAPAWVGKLKAAFAGLVCRFSASHFAISVPRDILRLPNLTADNFAYKNALRECQQLLEQEAFAGAFSQRVLNDIASSALPFPSLSDLAARYHMSSRTFIRKLKYESQSYQRLLDEVRKDIASWYLQNTTVSVEQVAELSGFVDSSNFSRVFRRWFACTPSEFRARAQ